MVMSMLAVQADRPSDAVATRAAIWAVRRRIFTPATLHVTPYDDTPNHEEPDVSGNTERMW